MSEQMQLDVFHFEEDKIGFDDFGEDNGSRYWYASDLMKFLGYESLSSFGKVINKATTTCLTLDIDVASNFIQVNREIDGQNVNDKKLSKFACYLVSMNGDPKKKNVAKAQAYFATLTEAVQKYINETEDVERVYIREEVSEHEKSLSSTAKKSGIQNFAFFQNKGYLGLYNMSLRKLKQVKGLSKNKKILDFVGKEELAANLFRITQTEAKIRQEKIRGQSNLEDTAFQVGKKVRKTMIDISNTRPEDLPLAQDIKKVKSDLKKTHKELTKKEKKE